MSCPFASTLRAPTVVTLAPALITTACYDREVNCRRAAAAAFQVSVGVPVIAGVQ